VPKNRRAPSSKMKTVAVVLEGPERLALSPVELTAPGDEDVVVDVAFSGISTGTERLLWSGRMPPFPGMGYPLIPGYESVGRVCSAGSRSGLREGAWVFVPGARCFGTVRGLFGGAASRLVVPGPRVVQLEDTLGESGVLLALAATAWHALSAPGALLPDLIVGHGVLGRLLARLATLKGALPTVWEARSERRAGGDLPYPVMDPDADPRRDYQAIYDVSGDASLLDALIARLAKNGEITLAGFYEKPLAFAFPPAFMREARIRVAAEWRPSDLDAVKSLIETRALSLEGLITHRSEAAHAAQAYRTAFEDPNCLKMVLDWRACA
jgi:bacteriochlorophyllide a dehydrogenase